MIAYIGQQRAFGHIKKARKFDCIHMHRASLILSPFKSSGRRHAVSTMFCLPAAEVLSVFYARELVINQYFLLLAGFESAARMNLGCDVRSKIAQCSSTGVKNDIFELFLCMKFKFPAFLKTFLQD